MKKQEYTFDNYNSWNWYKWGENNRASLDGIGEVHIRGKMYLGDEAREAMEKAGKMKDYERWNTARSQALKGWMNDTPHYRYSCDGGCLLIKVNGVGLRIHNRYGDGDFPVYIVNSDDAVCIPPFFRECGASVSDTEGTVEVMDYDCEGGKPLTSIAIAKSDMVSFRALDGAVIISIYHRKGNA